ncbi:HYC_CC_PP family protein [Spongiivirga citrea]|uniref:Secreted protein n=1 Tax=Spongiivirga citrea TaxID=1481457 RepID=A0A6M0CEQ0_9FLAO|nr:hypothetical protein [Spongiivirga citrea]NER16295.1 hypothetical protein [Spongiivirga citrea]
MKKVIHKITALFLSFIVLVASVSFTIDMHHCGSTLVDIAFFDEAHGCGMIMENSYDSNTSFEVSKMACCTDTFIAVEAQDELNTATFNLQLEQQLFLASFAYSYINLFEGLAENIVPFDGYPPPILTEDIHVLQETFLI